MLLIEPNYIATFFTANYDLTNGVRSILDSVTVTDGSWQHICKKMINTHSQSLPNIMKEHEAGELIKGQAAVVLHTLTRTNTVGNSKQLVIFKILYYYS